MLGRSAGPSEEGIREALGSVEDPDVGLPITELGMVRGIVVRGRRAQIGIALVVPNSTGRERLRADVAEAARGAGASDVYVDLTNFDDDERRALRLRLQGDRPPNPADVFAASRVIAVSSGKGGVGKSSLSANLAVALARRGKRVALIDADVYGFSVPRMMGVEGKPAIVDGLVIPPRRHGVEIVSVALFAQDEQTPIIWRGPMLHKALRQFVADVHWRDPEYVLIDMPPGTGDVALTMAQLLPATEVVVVTTPQPAAQKVAQRAAYMAKRVELEVTGVIENMSWFTANDGERYELFGSGGGELLAQQLEVPLLGRVPLVPDLREGSDTGLPIVASDPESEAAGAVGATLDALVEARPRRVRLPLINVS